MDSTTIIYLLILVILVALFYSTGNTDNPPYDNKEHLNVASNEAVQDIGALYNTQGTAVFPNANIVGSFNVIPQGSIIMWYGDLLKIPDGWYLCDGQNGTPDLQGRFVLGYGSGQGLTPRLMNQRGGAETVTLSVAQMPAHTHPYPLPRGDQSWSNGGGNSLWGGGWGGFNPNTGQTGGNQAHENMPPYQVLAYIMRYR